MGSTGNCRRLSERAYQALLANPELCAAVVCLPDRLEVPPAGTGGPPAPVTEAQRSESFLRAFDRLLTGGLAEAAEFVHADSIRLANQTGFPVDELGPRLNIDKIWRELQLPLAGNEHEPSAPPGDAVLGGTEIGPDLGYGPARLMLAREARETAAALERFTLDCFHASWDRLAEERADVQDSVWADDRCRGYIFSSFGDVRDYFRETAPLGWGMLLWLG